MNKQQLRELSTKLSRINDDLLQAVRDCEAYEQDTLIARCDTCERRRLFDNERGCVVRWDGDLWLLDDYQEVIYPLGHTRGGRTLDPEGDPEDGYITLACLEYV